METHMQAYRNDPFLLISDMPRLHAWSSGSECPLLEIIQGNGHSLQWRASEWQCVSWELLRHTNWGYTLNDFLILTTVNQMRTHSLTLYIHPHDFCVSTKIQTLCFCISISLLFYYFFRVFIVYAHKFTFWKKKKNLITCQSLRKFQVFISWSLKYSFMNFYYLLFSRWGYFFR